MLSMDICLPSSFVLVTDKILTHGLDACRISPKSLQIPTLQIYDDSVSCRPVTMLIPILAKSVTVLLSYIPQPKTVADS